jgi:DNA-binding NtrC family response regulator
VEYAPILLRGENGTGERVLARIVHPRSKRAGKSYIAVSCPTLSEELLASDLFGHAIGASSRAANRPPPALSPAAEQALLAYAWPGNIRELRNAMEQAITLFPERTLGREALPERIAAQVSTAPRLGGGLTVDQLEREHIERVIARATTLEGAAKILGIDASTLYRKRKKYES